MWNIINYKVRVYVVTSFLDEPTLSILQLVLVSVQIFIQRIIKAVISVYLILHLMSQICNRLAL